VGESQWDAGVWDCEPEESGLLPNQVIINEYLPGQGHMPPTHTHLSWARALLGGRFRRLSGEGRDSMLRDDSGCRFPLLTMAARAARVRASSTAGISPHSDGTVFAPIIATLSLSAPCVMTFHRFGPSPARVMLAVAVFERDGEESRMAARRPLLLQTRGCAARLCARAGRFCGAERRLRRVVSPRGRTPGPRGQAGAGSRSLPPDLEHWRLFALSSKAAPAVDLAAEARAVLAVSRGSPVPVSRQVCSPEYWRC
jgi:hypothetical protein